MRWLRGLLAWTCGMFRKPKLDRELDAELASHLEMHVTDNLRAGMTAEDARRVALMKLGGVEQTKESYRERRGLPWMDGLLQDVRFAARMLRKNPGSTAIAVLTLGLGIGANTAIFSVANTVLLRSLPFPRSSELLYISSRSTSFDFPNLGLSLPDIADVRSSTSSFASMATYQDAPKELTGGGKPERIDCTEVSEEFLPTLGIQPLRGRTISSSDVQENNRVAVLTSGLWKERFGGEPGVIGKKITLDGQTYTVIGVVAHQPSLDFATDSRLWIPFIPSKDQLAARENHAYSVVARMKSGASLERAQGELDTISARLATSYPGSDKGWTIHATSLKHFLLGDFRTAFLILFFAVGFVLLIACANVSNFFLARGWARRREFAIRAAMGATRGALLRQLIVESVLVALAGGVCALLAATWSLHGLRSMLPPGTPRSEDIRIDSEVAWFALGASLLSALLAGLAPALLSTGQNISGPIRESSGAGGVQGSIRSHDLLRQLLVIGEIAVAAILLIGATLAMRSFDRLLRLNLGFRPDHVVALRLDFPKSRFANGVQAIALVQQILDNLRGIQGLQNVSAGMVFPMSDEIAETNFQTEESLQDPKAEPQTALVNRVAPEFFQTLGIPLRSGRDFDATDAEGKPLAFIVNEALAHQSFGSLDVLGKRISFPSQTGELKWGEIVGVAGDVREATINVKTKPQIYLPFYQTPRVIGVYLMLRTKSNPMPMVAAVEERIWSVDKDQPISAIKTINARIDEANAAPRSQSLLLGIFGVLGFVIALVGVYGVMSYLVTLQTKDIGIRMALGAERRQILRLVVAHGMRLTLSGVFIGVVGGLVLTRFMSSLLFGISAADPIAFASVAILLTLVTLAACYFPARRATRVDPLIALRYE